MKTFIIVVIAALFVAGQARPDTNLLSNVNSGGGVVANNRVNSDLGDLGGDAAVVSAPTAPAAVSAVAVAPASPAVAAVATVPASPAVAAVASAPASSAPSGPSSLDAAALSRIGSVNIAKLPVGPS